MRGRRAHRGRGRDQDQPQWPHDCRISESGIGVTLRARRDVVIHGGTITDFVTGIFISNSTGIVVKDESIDPKSRGRVPHRVERERRQREHRVAEPVEGNHDSAERERCHLDTEPRG